MININKQVEIIVTGYIPQIIRKPDKYYNTNFDVAIVSLTQMYIQKYTKKYYQGPINTFKVMIY